MNDLAVGDHVLTDGKSNTFEQVYAFGHWDPSAKASFLQIQHQSGALELTEDHMLQVNGRFLKASSVKVGDTLQGEQGAPTSVTKIRHVTRKDGVFAPLTPSGGIVVDNVLASSYISLQHKGDEYPVFGNGVAVPISQQMGIHMVLSPYRLLCTGLKMDGFCHRRTKDGVSSYVDWGIQLAKFADNLSFGSQLVLLAFALVLILPFFALEALFGARYAPLLAFVAVVGLQWMRKNQWGSSKQKKL